MAGLLQRRFSQFGSASFLALLVAGKILCGSSFDLRNGLILSNAPKSDYHPISTAADVSLDNSLNQLVEAFNEINKIGMKINTIEYAKLLIDGYQRNRNVKGSLEKASCDPVVMLDDKYEDKFGNALYVEIVLNSGLISILEARDKRPLGHVTCPCNYACSRRDYETLIKRGYYQAKIEDDMLILKLDTATKKKGVFARFVEYLNSCFQDSKAEKRTFYFSRSVNSLKKIMSKRDPFGDLACMVNKRDLRVEYAMEDRLNRLYIMFFDDYLIPDEDKTGNLYFSIDDKILGLYAFRIFQEGSLALPVFTTAGLDLLWSRKAKKYIMPIKSVPNPHWILEASV